MTKRERILQLADGTRTAREIAQMVGVHRTYVNSVVCIYAPGKLKRSGKGLGRSGQRQSERNRAMLKAWQAGDALPVIAARHGISKTRVHFIVHRELAQAA